MLQKLVPDDRSSSGSSPGSSSTFSSPPYTPEELAAIFLDFYTFLTTLHYDAADLKIPPPEGWPELTHDIPVGWKSSYTIEVLRHLPYFNSEAAIHYKSALIDYTSHEGREIITQDDDYLRSTCEDDDTNPVHVIFIARGDESNGRDLLLDVQHGHILEAIRCWPVNTDDVRSYFDDMKEDYRRLKLIPCVGHVTIEAAEVDERLDRISEEEIRAQTEHWGTNLDIQYIRQLYRQHGWPDAFRKDDAQKALDELEESIVDTRNWWEAF